MKKSFIYFAALCCVAMLAACSDSSSSKSTSDGILGELDKYVQDFYANSDAHAAYGQRIFKEKDDYDKEKGDKLRKDLLESFEKLDGVLNEAIGRTVITELSKGTPLKVIKPFTVQAIEYRSTGGGKLKLSDEADENLRKKYNANKLENVYLQVRLEAEVELTEDTKAQEEKWLWVHTVRTFDNLITYCAATAEDSVVQRRSVITDFDYGMAQKAGTRLTIAILIADSCMRPYNHPAEDFFHINRLNKVEKILISWDPATAATLSDDAVKGELGLFELQGPVKKCTVINEWGNIVRTFDEQGLWLTHDGRKLSEVYPGGIERDEYGRIVKGKTDGEGNGEEYSYNKFGKIVKYSYHEYDTTEEDVYTYDDNGNLLKKHVQMGGMDAEEPYDETYTDIINDDHGNWTSRKANGTIQKRKIEYYN